VILGTADITDYYSQAQVNKMPFFFDVFPTGEFLLLFSDLHFARAEGQGTLKKDVTIKSVLDIIRSKCIIYYLPSATVTLDESTISIKGKVSFKTYNPIKPVKSGPCQSTFWIPCLYQQVLHISTVG
jgi:hypothetical protein